VNRITSRSGLKPSGNFVPVRASSFSIDVKRNSFNLGSAMASSRGRVKQVHASQMRTFCRRSESHGAWLNLFAISQGVSGLS